MLDFGIKDLVDVFLVAIVLFFGYKLMKKSRSVNIFYGVLVFISIWILVSKVLEMKLLGSILNQLVSVGAIAIIVLFQEEIRHFFYTIGTHERVNSLMQFFRPKAAHSSLDEDYRYDRDMIMPIVMACLNMSKQKVGALIIIERHVGLNEYIQTGDNINANITQRLIENIFFKNSPLHDGAMIISHKHIKAAGCILPISHDTDIPKSLGLRHRAALGISQKSDCLAVIVSEETGGISIAEKGSFRLRLSAEELESALSKEWGEE